MVLLYFLICRKQSKATENRMITGLNKTFHSYFFA